MRGGGSGWSLCSSGWACHEIVWGITNGWRVSTAPARRLATTLPSVPRWPPKPELGRRRRRGRRPKRRRGRRRPRRAREPRLESVSWKSDCARIELNLCDLEWVQPNVKTHCPGPGFVAETLRDNVVNYVCRDRAEGLWQYAYEKQARVSPTPNGGARV